MLIGEGVEEILMELWKKSTKEKDFGNGRGVRNIYETVITNQLTRVIGIKEPTKDDLTLILK